MISICIHARRVPPQTILGLLDVLVAHNVALYRDGEVTGSPWHLRWVPDEHDVVVLLQDVAVLSQKGYGSCGPLACAYAAYMIAVRRKVARVKLLRNPAGGPNSWHVIAVSGKTILDPQFMNRGQGDGAQQ